MSNHKIEEALKDFAKMIPADGSYYAYLTIGGELTDLYAERISLLYGSDYQSDPEYRDLTTRMDLLEQAITEIVYDHSCTKLKAYTELSAAEYSCRFPLTAYRGKKYSDYMTPVYLENLH